MQKIKDEEKKIKEEERKKQRAVEDQKIKEWEVKFDAERKKREEEQFLMEEEMKEKEEERRKKLEINFKTPDKIN